jgi:rod shape-determining protein MreB
MLFKRWAENFSDDLAIDLGTANTLVFVRGEGIVLNEPSVVAIHEADHSIIAVGREAKAMLGRTPGNIRVIRPLKDGVIADFDITEKMLGYFISQTHRRHRTILRPRVVVGVPSASRKSSGEPSATPRCTPGPAPCISLSSLWRRRWGPGCRFRSRAAI